MKILESNVIIEWLLKENESETGKLMPNGKYVEVEFSVKTLQIHIDHGCGCKITQDNLGEWLFACNKHSDQAHKYQDGKIIHQRL